MARQNEETQRRRDQYLTFLVHDLRTPLSAIAMAASLLKPEGAEAQAGGEHERLVKLVGRGVRGMEELIARVVEENRHVSEDSGARLECRPIELWPQVGAVMQDLHALAAKTETRLVNKVPDGLTVYADALALRRVLQNLIANAIKFSPGGEVVVQAESIPSDGSVAFSVRDTGKGIPAGLQEKIFDAGVKGPDESDGLGLGLAIVKRLVEAHGGKVMVESEEGVGTVFRVVLPPKAARRG